MWLVYGDNDDRERLFLSKKKAKNMCKYFNENYFYSNYFMKKWKKN